MELLDFILAPFYLMLIYFIAYRIRNVRYKDDPTAKYFIPGLTVKILAVIVFAFIYQYYYGGGDTFAYYAGADAYFQYFLDKPSEAIGFLFSEVSRESIRELKDYNRFYEFSHIFGGSAEVLTIKITGLIGLFTFNTYLNTSFIFAFISFTGVWALYRIFIRLYPQVSSKLAFAALFFPTVVFWGSGILKDTITLGCICWLTYASYMLFIKRRQFLMSIFIILLTGYLIAEIKGYVILAFAPALLFWIVNTYKNLLPSKFMKIIITPVVLLFIIAIGAILINFLSGTLERYSLENMESVAQATQNWHTIASGETGSKYSLGNIEYTASGMLRVFPAAVNVTLFRPYFWEAGGAVMIFSALESFLLLLFTLYVLLRAGIFRFFKMVFKDPFLLFCFIFTMIFAFAVGFTSYNFGALVRYKIPCLPFYLSLLFVVLYKSKIRKEQIKASTAFVEYPQYRTGHALEERL